MSTSVERSADAPAAAPSLLAAQPTAWCTNCGARLAGPYCSECGQRHHDHPVHSLWHFLREAAEDLTHADSRLWQTLFALLFRPGLLTREFLDGRRVRYLPPVRLYLVVSVIFFIIAGLQSRISSPAIHIADNGNSFQYKVVPHRAAGGPIAAVRATVSAQQACEKAGTYIEHLGAWYSRFEPRLERSCLAVAANGGPQRLEEILERNLERAMFLFLPLLALVMKPLYFKPPRYYVEHLLFFVHNHAFLFVVLGLNSLLETITSSNFLLGPLDVALSIYIPVYFYLAMRRVYEQDRWRTIGKLTVLSVAYLSLGMLMFVATFSYSFLMM